MRGPWRWHGGSQEGVGIVGCKGGVAVVEREGGVGAGGVGSVRSCTRQEKISSQRQHPLHLPKRGIGVGAGLAGADEVWVTCSVPETRTV